MFFSFRNSSVSSVLSRQVTGKLSYSQKGVAHLFPFLSNEAQIREDDRRQRISQYIVFIDRVNSVRFL